MRQFMWLDTKDIRENYVFSEQIDYPLARFKQLTTVVMAILSLSTPVYILGKRD